jgi:hypothetical protein
VKKQQGYVFRSGDSWFLRYRDTFVDDGNLVRRQVCRKLASVEPEHMRLKKPPASVLEMAEQTISPVNAGELQPDKNVTLKDFVERIYFVNMQGQKRESTLKGYRARWDSQLAARCGHVRLREFGTPHAQKVLADIGRANPELRRSTLHHLRSLLSAIFRHAIQPGLPRRSESRSRSQHPACSRG